MSILATLGALMRDLAKQGLSALEAIFERLRTLYAGDTETRRRVAFSVAMIALAAKMAKADGVVTQNEITAFRRIFVIPPEEVANVFRLYDLAQQDTAGYELYAARLRRLCSTSCDGDCAMLTDVLDGLFFIAAADGMVHERELDFLSDISRIFGLSDREFERIKARHVLSGPQGDYAILGVSPTDTMSVIRSRYLDLVRENHPDRLQARGLPEEFMAIATERMKAINAAWDNISKVSVA
ncbi:DnaJ family molecular chaperone [Aureimonas fodinaquatilis]|uniref:DnaJ family molecular chaperone n=1 Tax=Aureimonas fodinaquatilis TaxID=2565783 RepID=A0A5B0E169_9HYPH|nr:DnaJ family molecular chaperone [Aureimonas fodinaquatilis]KAA0972573.1 DnaJ family molecular chaperone [Aureimonas fodinaquatilis]